MTTIKKNYVFNSKIRRITLISILAALALLTLAACDTASTTDSGSGAQPAATSATTTSGDTAAVASADTPTPAGQSSTSQGSGTETDIQATLKEWSITLSQSEVPAGKVKFTVTNEGMMAHNLTVVDGSGAEVGGTQTFASSDGPQTLEVSLQPGTYTIICSLPGHAARGQRTQLTVK